MELTVEVLALHAVQVPWSQLHITLLQSMWTLSSIPDSHIISHTICIYGMYDSDLAGEAVWIEGELTRPHDQSGGWDWLKAASALTTSEHPGQKMNFCLTSSIRMKDSHLFS